MNIVIFTNTFSPHVGGVARSVSGLAEGLREEGHQVLVVAPEFPGMPDAEANVIRIPALQRFAGTDFSVPIPASRLLDDDLEAFSPDIVHSHHPFLLGGTALRTAAFHNLPLVFTYHTRFELYGHYALQDSPMMMRLARSLSLSYCDLCDVVIAPSASTAEVLHHSGIKVPVEIIPSGVDPSAFSGGDGALVRREAGIPAEAFVVGHVGRLAPEKNLGYLADSVIRFIKNDHDAHFLVAGDGPEQQKMRERFAKAGLSDRLHMVGVVEGRALADVYAAMDVFAFSSHSETQGLVLAEAMTAGKPVVALDAPGAREIVADGRNGRLLPGDAPPQAFAEALAAIAHADADERRRFGRGAVATSKLYTRKRCVKRTIELYSSVLAARPAARETDSSMWEASLRRLGREWDILGNVAQALGDAVLTSDLGK